MFFVLGIWPALLILNNLRPVLTLAEQLRRYQEDLDFTGVRSRFEDHAGTRLAYIRAVELAKRFVDNPDRGAAAFPRLKQADPNNGLLSYMEAAWLLSTRESAGAPARFDEIRDELQAARAAPVCEWYAAEATKAWRLAFRESGARADLNARFARDAACREQAQVMRLVGQRFLALADDLVDAGHVDRARLCIEATLDFCGRTLNQAISADVALACAEQLEQAFRTQSILRGAEHNWTEAFHTRARADDAARFRELLKRRRAAAAYDPILNLPVVREQPYRVRVSYLLASGVLVAGWVVLSLIALAALLAAGIARLISSKASPEHAAVGPGLLNWCWAGALVSGPSAAVAAAMLLVPVDPRAVLSQTWIQATIVLTMILTAAAVLTLARARASSGGQMPGSGRVWHWWWVAIAVLTLWILLQPGNPFGMPAHDFDEGLRMPQAAFRTYLIQSVAALLVVLGALTWVGWCLISWIRKRKRDDNPAAPGSTRGFLRSTAVLALWSWLILGIMALGAIRIYHRYDSRLAELTARDLEDEVAAWMGPVWKDRFFKTLP